jgi:glycosyltransferase involved in cell wall biosynthesis
MNSKPNICLVGVQIPFVKGGAEILIESLGKELQDRNYKCDIVQIPFKWHPKEMIMRSCLAARMLDLTESYAAKIDILIAFKFPAYVVNHPNKVVWLFHQHREIYDFYNTDFTTFTESDEDHDLRLSLVRLDQKVLTEAKKLFSCSQNVAERLRKYCGIESEVLYHPPRLMNSFKCSGFDNYLLSVGRLELNKRVDLIIRAMQKVHKDKSLIIVGDGPQKPNLMKLVNDLQLDDRISFKGWVDDKTLIELYSCCLGVVYIPQDEDYGYVTLEAFSSKKPVITASDSGGVLEFVRDNENGSICEPEQKQLAEKINVITRNTSEKWGKAGFDLVKRLSWEDCIEKLTSFDKSFG